MSKEKAADCFRRPFFRCARQGVYTLGGEQSSLGVAGRDCWWRAELAGGEQSSRVAGRARGWRAELAGQTTFMAGRSGRRRSLRVRIGQKRKWDGSRPSNLRCVRGRLARCRWWCRKLRRTKGSRWSFVGGNAWEPEIEFTALEAESRAVHAGHFAAQREREDDGVVGRLAAGRFLDENVWRYFYTPPVEEVGEAVPVNPACMAPGWFHQACQVLVNAPNASFSVGVRAIAL